MSTAAALPASTLPSATAASGSRAMLMAATIVVASVFLITEHDFQVSKAEAYTSSIDQMEASAGGGNLLRRIAFLGLAALGMTCLVLPSATRFRMTAAGALLAFFLMWAAMSVAWSDDVGMTIRRLMVLGCFTFGSLGLARRFRGEDLMRLCVGVALTTLTLGVAAEVALGTMRPFVGDYRFAGSQHPNTTALSLACICIASFCWWRAASSRGGGFGLRDGSARLWPAVLFCIGFGFLILTKSRTSAAGVLATLVFLWTLSTPMRIKAGVVMSGAWLFSIAAIVVLMAGLSIEDEVSELALMGRQEQSESLTGRLPIWTELAPFVVGQLITGYGYDSFWIPDRIERVSREMQWAIREAHCSYIDLVLSVGLIAAVALLGAILTVMRRRASKYLATGKPEHGFFLGLQLFCLINGLTESAMTMPLFVSFIACCGLAQEAVFSSENRAS